MSTLFVLKNVPVFFFSTSEEARLQTQFTPLPSRTCTVFWPSKVEILRCLETDREREGGGGGGVEFDTILSICFCIVVISGMLLLLNCHAAAVVTQRQLSRSGSCHAAVVVTQRQLSRSGQEALF